MSKLSPVTVVLPNKGELQIQVQKNSKIRDIYNYIHSIVKYQDYDIHNCIILDLETFTCLRPDDRVPNIEENHTFKVIEKCTSRKRKFNDDGNVTFGCSDLTAGQKTGCGVGNAEVFKTDPAVRMNVKRLRSDNFTDGKEAGVRNSISDSEKIKPMFADTMAIRQHNLALISKSAKQARRLNHSSDISSYATASNDYNPIASGRGANMSKALTSRKQQSRNKCVSLPSLSRSQVSKSCGYVELPVADSANTEDRLSTASLLANSTTEHCVAAQTKPPHMQTPKLSQLSMASPQHVPFVRYPSPGKLSSVTKRHGGLGQSALQQPSDKPRTQELLHDIASVCFDIQNPRPSLPDQTLTLPVLPSVAGRPDLRNQWRSIDLSSATIQKVFDHSIYPMSCRMITMFKRIAKQGPITVPLYRNAIFRSNISQSIHSIPLYVDCDLTIETNEESFRIRAHDHPDSTIDAIELQSSSNLNESKNIPVLNILEYVLGEMKSSRI